MAKKEKKVIAKEIIDLTEIVAVTELKHGNNQVIPEGTTYEVHPKQAEWLVKNNYAEILGK